MNYVELNSDNQVVNIFTIDPEVFPTEDDVIAAFTNSSMTEGHSIVCAEKNNNGTIDCTYDPIAECFIRPKPEDFPSFIWDNEVYDWVAPVAKPQNLPETVGQYVFTEEELDYVTWAWCWNETLLAWECLHFPEGGGPISNEMEAVKNSIPKVS
jgi:hypothetical protein